MGEKVLYAFWAGMFGSAFKCAQKVTKADGDDIYWHRDGNHLVGRAGFEDGDVYLCFAHKDKQRVDDFAKGFNAATSLLRNNFCKK